MGLTSDFSSISNDLSYYRVYFSLATSVTMMSMGLGHLVRARFHIAMENLLVVSVALVMEFFF